jgi:hypothetical protein
MIQLQVNSSPDLDMIGEALYYHQNLWFGRNQGDILINDPEMLNRHLQLKVSKKGLFAHPHPDLEYFHVNGKRVAGIKNIGPKDVLTLGKTKITIKNFMFDPNQTKSKQMQQNMKLLIEENSPLNEFIDLLEEEYEKEIWNQK